MIALTAVNVVLVAIWVTILICVVRAIGRPPE